MVGPDITSLPVNDSACTEVFMAAIYGILQNTGGTSAVIYHLEVNTPFHVKHAEARVGVVHGGIPRCTWYTKDTLTLNARGNKNRNGHL